MEDGEDLWLIEADQGDGWTRVRQDTVPYMAFLVFINFWQAFLGI
jgi:hypothetical protein